ncbi:copper chaperone for superoxide dismutase isoform X1 [Anomalospiza imberbis]|uniref:copper chaperone for superoxide dismutase isoform X1 n=1 Tax=Anomalospiza imberbis TaxID=187417 RepID=UPI00358F3752
MSHAVLLLRRLRERHRHREQNRDSDEEQDWDREQHRARDQDCDRAREQHQDRHRVRDQDCDRDREQHRDQHRDRNETHDRDRDETHDRDRDHGRTHARQHALHPAPTAPSRSPLPEPSGAPSAPSPSPSPRRGRRRRRPYPAQRIYRARCSFLELSDEQALRRCRLDRAAIAALCRELGADLQSLTGRSHALPVAVKVTSALAFLASGSFQTASRLSTGISQSAMSNCLAQFLAALQRRAARYIAFAPAPAPPGGPAALPGVLGLVGAMHVALRAPADNEPLFRNAANFHSINMQVVCDRRGHITNVVAKFPGSCANATVLENSALARLMEGSRPEGGWLLGDRSYPLKPWLLTPISGPRGAAELRYNALHARGLAPLRRTLGLLRRRFRCLAGGGLQYSPPKVCQIFLACCILHNIALRRRVPLEPPEGLPPAPGHPEPPPQPPPPPGPGAREGRAVRARVVQQVREGLG